MKKFHNLIVLLFLAVYHLMVGTVDTSKGLLNITSSITKLPMKEGLGGSFIDISQNVLIVAGRGTIERIRKGWNSKNLFRFYFYVQKNDSNYI